MSREYEIRTVQALTGERSLTLVLPKQYAIGLGLKKGDFVKVRLQNDSIVIMKAGWMHLEKKNYDIQFTLLNHNIGQAYFSPIFNDTSVTVTGYPSIYVKSVRRLC